jgi:hypothetical protein
MAGVAGLQYQLQPDKKMATYYNVGSLSGWSAENQKVT